MITKDDDSCPGKGIGCTKHGAKFRRHLWCYGCSPDDGGIGSRSAGQTTHHLEATYHESRNHLSIIELSICFCTCF